MEPVPPLWMHAPTRKPSTTTPGSMRSRIVRVLLAMDSDAEFDAIRERAGQTAFADPIRRARGIVDDAEERDLLASAIEQRICRCRIAVAGLSDRADDRDPAPMRWHRDRRASGRSEFAHRSARRLEDQPLIVNVAAKRERSARSFGAAPGGRPAVDVVPAPRRCRRGVGIDDLLIPLDQREGGAQQTVYAQL